MIKWISIQSLLGGEMIGAEQAFGSPPVMCIDYECVPNSDLYVAWLKDRGLDVPHVKLYGDMFSKSESIMGEHKETFDRLNKDIDVVCAVPVCSGLSKANSSRKSETACGSDARQNDNMLGIAEFTLKHISPKVYLFENAPALFSASSEGIRSKLNALAKEHGYVVSYIKTNTVFHGLPQKRVRTFCIMWKGEEVGVIENPKYMTPIPFEKIISGKLEYVDDEYVPFQNFKNNPYIKYCYAKYGKEKYRGAFNDGIVDILQRIFKNNDVKFAKQVNITNEKFCKYLDYAKSKFDNGMNVMNSSPIIYIDGRPVCTIYARNQVRIVHPKEERGLNIREMMRLMGMPDDFYIESKNASMIGQNVPVNTARYYCGQIRKFLNGKLETKKIDVNFQTIKQTDVPAQLEFDFN